MMMLKFPQRLSAFLLIPTALQLIGCAPKSPYKIPPQSVSTQSAALASPAPLAELQALGEPTPKSNTLVCLQDQFWNGRKIFLSIGIERASVTGLAMSVIGYIPVELKHVGNSLLLMRVNQGLFGGTILGPEIPLNSYPIVSETADQKFCIDLARPETPYGMSLAGINAGGDSSTELSPRFQYIRDVQTDSESLSFMTVLTAKSPVPFFQAGDDSSEGRSGMDPYMVNLVLRTDWVILRENEAFIPTENTPGLFGYFLSTPSIIENGSSERQWTNRISTQRPFEWEYSANTPEEFASAVESGILAWNEAFGSDVLKTKRADGTRTFTDPRKSNLIWDDNKAVGMAFANWRTNPFTGEIVQAQIYMSGDMWAEQAQTIYKLRALDKQIRDKRIAQPSAPTAAARNPSDPFARISIIPLKSTKNFAQDLRSQYDTATKETLIRRGFVSLNSDLANQASSQHVCQRTTLSRSDFKKLNQDLETLAKTMSQPLETQPSTGSVSSEPYDHLPYPQDGMTLDSFKKSVVRSVVMHEAGHTMGLRHNFLGSKGQSNGGKIRSASIMDYNDLVVDADFDRPGDSDKAIIAMGYNKVAAPEGLLFCTDEDAAAGYPECARFDGMNNPVTYHSLNEESSLLLGLRLYQAGAFRQGMSFLVRGLRAASERVKTVMASTEEGIIALQDPTYAERQKQAWKSLESSREMFGVEWPQEVKLEYSLMVTELVANGIGSKSRQSLLAALVIQDLGTYIRNSDIPLVNRLALISGLQRFQTVGARNELKQTMTLLKDRIEKETALATDEQLAADEEVLGAIERLMKDGYFLRAL
jgi:hypothetical protein